MFSVVYFIKIATYISVNQVTAVAFTDIPKLGVTEWSHSRGLFLTLLKLSIGLAGWWVGLLQDEIISFFPPWSSTPST